MSAQVESEVLRLLLEEDTVSDELGAQIEQLIMRSVSSGVRREGDSRSSAKRTLREIMRGGCGSSGERKAMCCYVFKRGDLAYNCQECQSDETCVTCETCYRNSNHVGHRVTFQRINTTGTGCCDCGDPEAWDPVGFCACHGPMTLAEKMAGFSPELLEACRSGIAACVAFVLATARVAAVVGGFRGELDAPGPSMTSPLSDVAQRICDSAKRWEVRLHIDDTTEIATDVVPLATQLFLAGPALEPSPTGTRVAVRIKDRHGRAVLGTAAEVCCLENARAFKAPFASPSHDVWEYDAMCRTVPCIAQRLHDRHWLGEDVSRPADGLAARKDGEWGATGAAAALAVASRAAAVARTAAVLPTWSERARCALDFSDALPPLPRFSAPQQVS